MAYVRSLTHIIGMIVFLWAHPSFAAFRQEKIVSIRQLKMEDGLVSRKVNCGLQDAYGFIWFGTTNGLQRYDGINFMLLTKERNNLQSNNIADLVQDDQQNVWIKYGLGGTDRYSSGIVDILDVRTLQVRSLRTTFGRSLPFNERNIKALASNEKHEIVIVVSDNNVESDIYLYSTRRGFERIAEKLQLNYANPQLLQFHDRRVLFYSHRQTGVLDLDGKVTCTAYDLSRVDNLFPLGIASNGRLYAGTSSHNTPGRLFPRPEWVEVMPGGLTRNQPVQLFENPSYKDYQAVYYQPFYDSKSGNTLIYQQKKGFMLFNGTTLFTLADTNAIAPDNGFITYDYFSSRDQKHWVCTSNGVFIITVKQNLFEHLLSTNSCPMPSVLDHQTRSICADSSGHLYVNCWGGFYRLTRLPDGTIDYRQLLRPEVSTFNGFYFDGKNFWMASSSGRNVNCFDVTRNAIDHYDSDSLSVWSGITTKAGHLILGSIQGMHVLKDGHFSKLKMAKGIGSSPCWVYQFFYAKDGSLWAVTDHGLYMIDEQDVVVAHYGKQEEKPGFAMPYTDLHAVLEDKAGNFWMATNGAGLVCWNRFTGSSRQFTVADGLSSNVLYGILDDEKGNFWISSDYGLMRFNPRTSAVKTYTTADGITDNEFNRISYFKARDGRMYFGGMNGVNAFMPSHFPDESTPLQVPLRITSFSQFDGRADRLVDKTTELSMANRIDLQPGDRFFTLAFQLLDFEKTTHRYAYKIDGVDRQWNFINENTLRISGLPYGKFVLRIKGQNAEGAWSQHELSIPLIVKRPLTSQWWFRMGAIILIGGTGIYWYRRRTRSLTLAKQALERTVNQRTEELKKSLVEKEVLLKEIHHRVKNNLQVIVSLLDMQQEKNQLPELQQPFSQAKANVRSISLIHENLYRHENLSTVEMDVFIRDLFQQVNAMYNPFKQPVQFDLQRNGVFLDIDSAVPLGLIINELLTNSFKYAFPHVATMQIRIGIREEAADSYQFTYSDNGPGIQIPLSEATTMGMNLVRDLGRQLSGRLSYGMGHRGVFELKFLSLKARKEID